jgi:hypothetical protein
MSGDPTVWCEPPEPSTIAAEVHCGCWHEYALPCCWCGNDDDDDPRGLCPGGPEPMEGELWIPM